MLSPLKLSVIVCGAAVGLAAAPYFVKQVLPAEAVKSAEGASPPLDTGLASLSSGSPSGELAAEKFDLPIEAPAAEPSAPAAPIEPVVQVASAVATPAPVASVVAPSTPAELQLSAPALPSPAPIVSAPEMTLPSLQSPQTASAAMPTPSITPAPTPAPTPMYQYRSEVATAQKLLKQLGTDTGKIDGKLGPNTQTAIRNFQEKKGLKANGEVDDALIAAMEKAVAALPRPTPAPEKTIEVTDASSSADTKAEAGEVAGADDPNVVVVRKKAEVAKADEKAAEKEESKKTAAPKADPGPVPTLQNMADVRKLQEQLELAGTYSGPIDGKWGDLTRAAMREFQEKAGVEVTGRPNKETWLAMHSGKVRGASTPKKDDKAVAEKSEEKPAKTVAKAAESKDKAVEKKSADSLKISSADSKPSDEAPLVVKVNGDGVSNPDGVKPLATPASVSTLEAKGESSAATDKAHATVKVSAPARSKDKKSESDADSKAAPRDLAVASEDKEAEQEQFRKELASRRAQIDTVGSDYDGKKYAPKTMEAVNNMVADFKIEAVSNNPTEARERLAKIDQEIERAKSEAMKKKATETVEGVRKSYDALKKTFPSRIKALSLKDSEQKAQREELTELVAKVDLGFEAMEKDFKKGNYDPIFDNGKQFRSTIDEITRTVAEVYVSARLDEKTTRAKLDKSAIKEIEQAQKSEDHLKAAARLDSALEQPANKKKS